MIYKSCDHIEHGLYFSTDFVCHCCHLNGKDIENEKILSNYHGEILDWQQILDAKMKKREAHQRGEFSPCCQNCPHLREADWEDEFYVNMLFLSHFTKCNSNCTYCFTAEDKKRFNSFKEYSILPVLEDLAKNKSVHFDGTIFITGGEPTELKELDKIIEFFEKNNQQHYFIQTSGIKYSKAIEQILEKGKATVTVSPDAGSKDTYKKIKRVNAFNKVMDNLKKYNEKTKGDSVLVTKYIFVPEINDNRKEVDLFFDACQKRNLKNISLDFESGFLTMYPKRIPEMVPQLIKHLQQRGENSGINVTLEANAAILLNNLDNNICATISKNPINKEYFSCEENLHTICFMPEGLRHCMYLSADDAPDAIKISEESPVNPDYVFDYKHKIEEQRRKGKIHKNCKNCFMASKKIHDNREYISKVLISHRTDCNAECTFCYNRFDKDTKYDLYPIMPQLEQFKPYFKNGCEMHFGGGEPTIWEEFDEMIDFAIKEKFSNIFIATNGTRFSQKLADAIAMGKVQLVVTTDTADELVFKNLKGISLEDVTENLKKYIEYDKTGSAIQNKYIIIPNVNDNEDSINQWIEYNKQIGIKNLAIDIEACFFSRNRNKISVRLKKLVSYAEQTIQDNGLNCILYNFASQMRFDDKK